MAGKDKIARKFRGVEGGLFTKVTKADVGDSFASMAGQVVLMGWADPFYPDPSVPETVKEALIEAAQCGIASHYTMPIGSVELREEIAKKCKAYNHLDVDPRRNIIITPGSDSGLFYAMTVFLDPGDEVLVPDPSYPSNFLNPTLMGGVTVPVPLDAANGYQFDMDAFERCVTDKTKMVLITHPNNPTTTVFRRESLEALAEFVIRHDLILVVDQAFGYMIFDGVEFVSPASLPGMWERTVTVCSISKGMALSGYRVAYIVADDHIMDVYYGSAVSVIGATNTASQLGAIAALKDASFLEEYNRIFDRRRKIVYEIFNSIPGVSMAMPESTFLCWVNVSRLGTADEVNAYIIKEANVVVNAGTPYGAQGEGHLRIVFGAFREDAQMVTALERVKAALMKLGKEKGVS